MLVLFETAAGYALFKVLDEGKIKEATDLFSDFQHVDAAKKVISLKEFHNFENTTEALAAASAMVESKLHKGLKSFLKSSIVSKKLKEKLAVQDSKLGTLIKDELGIKCVSGNAINELMRGIRLQICNLIQGLQESDLNTMSLGLSHSLSRYKLKFSPDKVDTMIVQAIGLLDDLDKELNTYSMRVKEWYGWHFPELAKVVPDNLQYCRTIQRLGNRKNAPETSFSDILPEEIEREVKEVVQISMGTEISEEDISHISDLCQQVIDIFEYRDQLYEYLKNRMQAIAPNLTIMVGELVGARLIAHAGSLMNLAKHPASTVQILGAEKALFRALKTKHETPKYGLIYHAQLIGQTTPKNKGKISRVLAAKTALSVRVDALGEKEEVTNIASDLRAKVEERIRQVDGGQVRQISGKAKTVTQPAKFTPTPTTSYNTSTDSTITIKKEIKGEDGEEKKKKKKKKAAEEEEASSEEEKKKKKKKKVAEETPIKEEDGEGKKKKKKKRRESESMEVNNDEEEDGASEKKKKKRKRDSAVEESTTSSKSNGEEKKKKKKKKSSKD